MLVGYPVGQPELAATQRRIAARLGVPYVDSRARFAKVFETQPWSELPAPGGHCNDAGYAILARFVADVLLPRLRADR